MRKPTQRSMANRLRDMEYVTRTARSNVLYLWAAVPVLVYAGVSYQHLRTVSAPALVAGVAAYAVVAALIARRTRRETLNAMRREGAVDDSYRPPE